MHYNIEGMLDKINELQIILYKSIVEIICLNKH